ncbi:sulfatase-like hydrolase/transferase [Tundrisphaera sp. TA3]|uniref:sulfatase-like hydrolase/transferase n=1 Tax=Tundrisphaera sp. TA3 TaxID=3435775 RepID=UPI003EBA023A
MRLAFPRIVLASLAAFGLAGHQARAAESRPNIVLIMSDDMGFSDLGCYGGEIETPNLDALAGKGVRFTQFYNTARCCPTRASLLTGLYPHQAGIGHMTNDRGFDGYRGVLNRQSVTIAEALRPAGYRTYMCGKWHVTRFMGPDGDRATWPLGRGFEKFYGTIAGAGNYFDPGTLTRQDRPITIANDPEYKPESYYYTDALSDNAVKYIGEHQAESPDKPFFLYLAYTAAHWPMQAPEAAIARYKGRFDAGFEVGRAARIEKMKAMGLIPPGTELSPGTETWADVKDKAWEARCKEVYAAMITTMDAGIGRIVAELKAKGQYDNTVILFLQDNGACAETTGRIKEAEPAPANLRPLRPDELQPKTAPPMQTRDGRWIRTGPGVMPGPADTYLAYGRDWANVSNTPFREYKHWTHEGGISTPLIAHWPAGIKPERAGQFERQPGHLIDIMATCVDLSGATYPAEFGGQAIKPREGVSLRPAFAGESLNRPQPIFWEHESNRAVRDGRWKLVAKAGEPWELYDIDADRAEMHDLASAQPERVKAMAAQWDAYAARANVLPLGAWREKEGAQTAGSPASRFTLHQGDHLPAPRAPGLVGHAFTVEAKFRTAEGKTEGVIVAQGGTAAGFTLFVQGDRPRFLLRSGDGVARAVGPKLTPGEHTAVARVDADGSVTLAIDGGPAAGPAKGSLLARMPKDGLEVGSDENGAVGPYESPFPFTGKVESVVIEVVK